jgi:hypothetical protein
MKRTVFLFAFIFIYFVANCLVFGQAAKSPKAAKACPFSIIGLWKSDITTQSNPVFFNFSPNGWVTLLGYSDGLLPQDFEMIAEVTYQLDKPAAPKQIEFRTNRGNDAFPPGITLLKIVEYSDNSFTTLDEVSEQKIHWVKEQPYRYFLTFIARSSSALPQDDVAYVMWTTLDGRYTKKEALGVQSLKDDTGKTVAVFGQIPSEIYERLTEENEKDRKDKKVEIVMMRFELTQTEFTKTHQIYELWEQRVKTQKLPHSSPYLNGMELLNGAVDELIPCGEKNKLYKPTQRDRDEIVAKHSSPQQAFAYIKGLRQKNTELHVDDAMFPWNWRPLLQVPSQVGYVSSQQSLADLQRVIAVLSKR